MINPTTKKLMYTVLVLFALTGITVCTSGCKIRAAQLLNKTQYGLLDCTGRYAQKAYIRDYYIQEEQRKRIRQEYNNYPF